MNHFSDIGFIVDSEDDFFELAKKATPLAEGYPVVSGEKYLRDRDESGVELWFQIGRDGRGVGVVPAF